MNGDVDIVPIGDVPVDAVVAFFDRVPDGDRTFFKEPVAGAATVQAWTSGAPGGPDSTRLVAVVGQGGERSVVGYAALIGGVGWSSHVSELRLVVDPEHRRQGLGHRLAAAALEVALESGATKVVVEAIASQDATVGLFLQLGFVAEAILEDHVRDANGGLHDLIVLAHRSADTWGTLATVGLDAPLD